MASQLKNGAAVLDVGCGTGVPITRALAGYFTVTGVDISSEMIKRARENVPQASFIHGDITTLEFPSMSFDSVVSFYSIFHLPREEQSELFRHIYEWLKPGGYLLTTLSLLSEEAYTEDDFFGVTMYWSNYGLDEYKEILCEVGFRLLETTAVGHGYTEVHREPAEYHPLFLAQKA